MFDFKFIMPTMALMLLLAYAFFQFPHLGDFDFHSTNKGIASYPSGVAFLVNLIPLPQGLALFVFALLVSVVLPYILVFEITKNKTAAWVYLFGSMIPTMLVSLYFVPQALIQLFMLASILFFPFFIVFAIFGGFVHNSWFFAFIVAMGFYLWKRESTQ